MGWEEGGRSRVEGGGAESGRAPYVYGALFCEVRRSGGDRGRVAVSRAFFPQSRRVDEK